VLSELEAGRGPVFLGVNLARFVAMLLGVEVVGVGDVGVVCAFLMVAGGMGLGRGVMVLGGVLVMSGGALVVFDLLLVGHDFCG
jgi:hypothetical protein